MIGLFEVRHSNEESSIKLFDARHSNVERHTNLSANLTGVIW